MGEFTKNMDYFLSEVKTIFGLNRFSSILSMVSLTMIFFVALLAVSGWWVSSSLVDALRNEAEISVYYPVSLPAPEIDKLKESISSIDGVQGVAWVKAAESYSRMEEILGKDAGVLSHYQENPFEAYFEIGIELEKLDDILKAVAMVPNVEYVRDNQTVLEKLSAIANVVTLLGMVVAAAVVGSTFIITSHIIREGVHSHRDQINTLKLLGAPDWFINAPFVIEGFLLTGLSGAVAGAVFAVFAGQIGQMVSGAVPFLPPMDLAMMTDTLVIGMLLLAAAMGIAASFFGLKMVREK